LEEQLGPAAVELQMSQFVDEEQVDAAVVAGPAAAARGDGGRAGRRADKCLGCQRDRSGIFSGADVRNQKHQRQVVDRRWFEPVAQIEAARGGVLGVHQQQSNTCEICDLEGLQDEVLDQRRRETLTLAPCVDG
jgi:hypothetical protein